MSPFSSPDPGPLKRQIGGFTATSLVVANMIGAGIFTTSGLLAGYLPSSGWILAAWVVGGLIALSGALCYAELATRMPQEGGEYVYLRRLFHPSLGFLTGWTSFIVGFTVPIAGSAMGFSEYVLGGLEGDAAVWIKKGVAVGIIALFTAIHYRGVRLGGRVQNGLTALKVLLILGLASAGLWASQGGGVPIRFLPLSNTPGLAVGTAMMLVMFSYSGWNATAYIAGEVRHPRRVLPLSLIGGTLTVMLLYVAMNVFVLKLVPFDDLRGTVTVVEAASVRAFGPWVGRGLGLMAGVALLSSLCAFILIGPRVYYAMARDRQFFPFAARVHPRYGVPGSSILIQGGLAMVAVALGSFEQLLVYIGFALNLFPWLAVAGLFVARRRRIGEEMAVKVWGYPVLPIFYLASSLVLMGVAFVNRPLESSLALATVALGAAGYLWGTRRRWLG